MVNFYQVGFVLVVLVCFSHEHQFFKFDQNCNFKLDVKADWKL